MATGRQHPIRDLLRLTGLADTYKVVLISLQQAVNPDTATGQLFRNIVISISKWERGVIRERTRDTPAHKRRNGERGNPLRVQGTALPGG